MEKIDRLWDADHATRLQGEIVEGLREIMSRKAIGASDAVVRVLESAVEAKIAQISQLYLAQLEGRPRRLN